MTNLEETAARLDALGNTTRLELYRLLVRAGDPGLSVGEIQEKLEIPASTLSHHLKHLVMVGLVARSKSGTTHHCAANYNAMHEVLAFLTNECCLDAPEVSNDHLAHKLAQ